jgi:molybdopterin synthase sulfur carrier subunit
VREGDRGALTVQVQIRLPGALRPYADGQRLVDLAVPGSTVGELLDALHKPYPGVHQRVVDELGSLRPHVNVFVNGESIRYLGGLATPLDDGDEVWFLPAISGG